MNLSRGAWARDAGDSTGTYMIARPHPVWPARMPRMTFIPQLERLSSVLSRRALLSFVGTVAVLVLTTGSVYDLYAAEENHGPGLDVGLCCTCGLLGRVAVLASLTRTCLSPRVREVVVSNQPVAVRLHGGDLGWFTSDDALGRVGGIGASARLGGTLLPRGVRRDRSP